MDSFAWSQAQLAREADVSTSVVARVLKNESISRRNAEKILAAINRKYKAMGGRDPVALSDFPDIHITSLHKARSRSRIRPVENQPGE
jgi:hypothetical protein